jgi:hypothetical protein
MNPSRHFAEAARRAFDNLSVELQKPTDNFTKKLEEFFKIMDNNDVDGQKFVQVSRVRK